MSSSDLLALFPLLTAQMEMGKLGSENLPVPFILKRFSSSPKRRTHRGLHTARAKESFVSSPLVFVDTFTGWAKVCD